MSNNPIEVNLFDKIVGTNESQTEPVRLSPSLAPIAVCLHPPTAVAGFEGIPTNDARSQVIYSPRLLHTNRPPLCFKGFKVGRPDLSNGVRMMRIIPNGCRVQSIAFISDGSTDNMVPDLANTVVNDTYDYKNFKTDALSYRKVAGSNTTTLNATAFNDTGTVTAAQINPVITFAGTLNQLATSNYDLFHALMDKLIEKKTVKVIKLVKESEWIEIKNRTTQQTAKTTEGLDNWLKLPLSTRMELGERYDFDHKTHGIDMNPNALYQFVNLGKLTGVAGQAPTDSQILSVSLRSYAGMAKEGSFLVQRLNTVSPAWMPALNSVNDTDGLYYCYFIFVDAIGAIRVGEFYENSREDEETTNVGVLKDTAWSNDMTWGLLSYDGLTLNPNGPTSQQLLVEKIYAYYEIQPAMTSAWAGMQRLGPKPNLAVLQATEDAFYELKDAAPARFNFGFWSAMSGLLGKGLKTFGSGLVKELGGKMMDSIVGPKKGSNKPNNKPHNNKRGPKKPNTNKPPQNKPAIKEEAKAVEQVAKAAETVAKAATEVAKQAPRPQQPRRKPRGSK